jgi:hypothetical protein
LQVASGIRFRPSSEAKKASRSVVRCVKVEEMDWSSRDGRLGKNLEGAAVVTEPDEELMIPGEVR